MSEKSQIANMKALAKLLESDLSFVHGERESGPNGAKNNFHHKGRAFLSELGKDLGFSKKMVRINRGGIAVSGEVSLKGMWSADNGLDVVLERPPYGIWAIRYRTISNMKDFTGGVNMYINASWLARGDYGTLLQKLRSFKKEGGARADVA